MTTLPLGWHAATLDDIGEWSSGGTPHRANASYYGGTIPWVKTGDLRHSVVTEVDEFLTPDGLRSSSAKLFPKGTLLVAMYGATIGQTGLLGVEAATNQACAALIAQGQTKGLVPFVWRYLIGRQRDLRALGQGGAQPNISQTILKALPILVPPLPEQRRIVAKIDSLTGTSRRAQEHLDHIPRLIEKYKQAVLAAAFKDVEGEAVKLGDLVAPGNPIRYGVLQPGSIKDTGVAMIRVCDLVAGKIAWQEVRRIAPSVDAQFASARVQNGDVLLSVVGTIGRVAVVSDQREPTNIARAVARVRPDTSRVLTAWLGWRLSAPDCQRSFASDAREVARKTLNVSLIRATTFVLPALDQQSEMVRSIEAAFAAIDRLAAEATSARKLLDRLDQSILAKAFRGELVPQDANDEPASVLLERIRAEREAAPKAKRGRVRKTTKAAVG